MTTFYWDFLLRHSAVFAGNNRMALPLKHVEAMSEEERTGIRAWAEVVRGRMGMGAR
jgi:deoxyribodipyrimidine photolyase-related protein